MYQLTRELTWGELQGLLSGKESSRSTSTFIKSVKSITDITPTIETSYHKKIYNA